MTYYQFVQTIEQKLKETAKENVHICIHNARKYNGVIRQGILFSDGESNVSPTIYLEEYYERFHLGVDLDAIAGDILALYRKLHIRESWKEVFAGGYDSVRERIVYRLINREKNRELLEGMPYVPYLDLAVVFYILLEAGTCGTATIAVKTEYLKRWGITKEQLYEQARRNTKKILPCELRPMREVLAELTGVEEPGTEEEVLYVLSNQLRCFGACAILEPEMQEEAAARLGEDYYVLPGSVHEMLLIGKNKAAGKDFLRAVVREINETQVEEEEVLSNQVYEYDCHSKKVKM